MKHLLASAVGILLLLTPGCRPSGETPTTAATQENPQVTQIVRDYLTASLANDTSALLAMYVDEVQGLEGAEEFLAQQCGRLIRLGEPVRVSYLNRVPGGSGTTHFYRVEFAALSSRLGADVDAASGMLKSLDFERIPTNPTDDFRDRFDARVFVQDGGILPYRLLKPDNYDESKSYPLVLVLHGAGQRGDENRAQIERGVGRFSSQEMMERHPSFVVAPQCPTEYQWVDTPWSADAHTMPEAPTEPLRLTLALLDSLEQEFSIDAGRIYVTGLSMGGFGTWDAIQRRPHRFAAAVPICGGGDPAFAGEIAQIPIWAFHGDSDTVVQVSRSREMIAAIEAVGGEPRYTEYPGIGHNSWTAAYADGELYTWLYAQRLAER